MIALENFYNSSVYFKWFLLKLLLHHLLINGSIRNVTSKSNRSLLFPPPLAIMLYTPLLINFRRLLSSKAAVERNLFDLTVQNQYGKNVLHYLGIFFYHRTGVSPEGGGSGVLVSTLGFYKNGDGKKIRVSKIQNLVSRSVRFYFLSTLP